MKKSVVFPENERPETSYYDRSGRLRFVVSSINNRSRWRLYGIKDGRAVKLSEADSPGGFPDIAERNR